MKINHSNLTAQQLKHAKTVQTKYELLAFKSNDDTGLLHGEKITKQQIAELGIHVLQHLQSIPQRVTSYVQAVHKDWSSDKITTLMFDELQSEITQGLNDNNVVYQKVIYPFLLQQLSALQTTQHVGTMAYLWMCDDDGLSKLDFDSPLDVNVDLASKWDMEVDHCTKIGSDVWYQLQHGQLEALDVIQVSTWINQYFGLSVLPQLSHWPIDN